MTFGFESRRSPLQRSFDLQAASAVKIQEHSSVEERLSDMQEIGGSSPPVPTITGGSSRGELKKTTILFGIKTAMIV